MKISDFDGWIIFYRLSSQIVINYRLGMATKLGEDVINFYKPYRNDKADWKNTVISKQKFEIYGRYEIIDVSNIYLYLVGQGAYGIVVAAKDKEAIDKTKELVAIKKIDKAF